MITCSENTGPVTSLDTNDGLLHLLAYLDRSVSVRGYESHSNQTQLRLGKGPSQRIYTGPTKELDLLTEAVVLWTLLEGLRYVIVAQLPEDLSDDAGRRIRQHRDLVLPGNPVRSVLLLLAGPDQPLHAAALTAIGDGHIAKVAVMTFVYRMPPSAAIFGVEAVQRG